MHLRNYRLVVIGSSLSWLLVGMHLPVLHHLGDDGHVTPWTVLGITLLLAVGAVAGLWALLRAPSRS